MQFDDFMAMVRAAARRVGVTRGPEMAMLLASAHIESKALYRDEPSVLAFVHHNIFGIKWVGAGDLTKGYSCVPMKPNQFETAATIYYRGYASLEHCITNWVWHRQRSSYYKDLADRAAMQLKHGEVRETVYADWTRLLGERWQSGNADHGRTVELLYWKYLERESEIDDANDDD